MKIVQNPAYRSNFQGLSNRQPLIFYYLMSTSLEKSLSTVLFNIRLYTLTE